MKTKAGGLNQGTEDNGVFRCSKCDKLTSDKPRLMKLNGADVEVCEDCGTGKITLTGGDKRPSGIVRKNVKRKP